MRLLIAIFTALPVFFIGLGVHGVIEQQRNVIAARPVQATMEQSTYDIKSERDSKGRRTTLYLPVVSYLYTVEGRIYRGNRAYPARTQVSREAAEQLQNNFPAGQTVTAWYSPSDPARSHLVHEAEFGPYLLILFPMLHLSVGLGLVAAGVGFKKRKDHGQPIPGKGGWFELPLQRSMARRKRPWLIITVAWYLVGIAAAIHYFGFVPQPWSTIAWISFISYGLIGVIPVIFWIRHHRIARGLHDVRVWVDTPTFTVGRSFRLRTEQSFHRPLILTDYKAGLICEITQQVENSGKKRSAVSTSTDYEAWSTPESFDPAPTIAPVEIKETLKIPVDRAPSTAGNERALPRHAWRIVVSAKIKDHAKYRAEFPIVVKARGDK